jgi:hypothetical protein
MKQIIFGIVILLATFGGGYWVGKDAELDRQAAEVAKFNEQARVKEQILSNAVTTTANALRISNEKAKTAAKERDAALDNGTFKLRVPVKAPACATVSASTDPSAPSGDSAGETRTELDPAFGKALFAITDEGDRAIEKLNSCIDLYNKALESQKEIK